MADSYVNTNAPLASRELAEPIKLNTNNLSSIVQKGAGYVEHLVNSAPVQLDRLFGVKTGMAATMALEQGKDLQRQERSKGTHAVNASSVVGALFARGDSAYDVQHCKNVTVVKAGTSEKTGKPVYKVVDKAGHAWVQAEKRLQQR